MKIVDSYGNELGYMRGSEYVIIDKYGSQLGYINEPNDIMDKYDNKLGSGYNGSVTSAAQNITAYAIGETGPGGGKIFYRGASGFTHTLDSSTRYYLEAAPPDISGSKTWASTSFLSTNIPGTLDAIGTGSRN